MAGNAPHGRSDEACEGLAGHKVSNAVFARVFTPTRGHSAKKFAKKFRGPALSETPRGFPPYGCPDLQEPPLATAAHSLSREGMLGAALSSRGSQE